jgi:hypothetical protein
VSDVCEDRVKPGAQSLMDIVKVCRKPDASRFPAIADCKFAWRRWQPFWDGMSGTSIENASNCFLK